MQKLKPLLARTAPDCWVLCRTVMLREVSLKSPSIPKFLLYPQLRLCLQASQTRRHLGPRDSPVHRRLPPSVHCVSPTNRGVLGGSYSSLSTELSAQPAHLGHTILGTKW